MAKIDEDGTIHIKPAKGPQVIVEPDSRLLFLCEKVSYFTTDNQNDERLRRSMTTPKILEDGRISFGIMCGKQTILERGVHYQDVAKPEAERVSA